MDPESEAFPRTEAPLEKPSPHIDEVEGITDEPVFTVSQMTEILETGSDSQRTVILFELHQLLEHFFEETLEVMVPVLCKLVASWSYDLQISVSESLQQVSQKTLSGETSKIICDAAFDVITRTRSPNIFEAWAEILVIALPQVQWNNNDISSVIAIIDDFSISNDAVCRKLVARVLGSFSSCLSTVEVETYVLNRALQLADDQDIEVRGMVSESLAFIGAVIEIDVVEARVWPKLLSLLRDTDARVHAATLQTIAHIAEVHKKHRKSSPLFQHLLPPVFAKECEFARHASGQDQRKVDDDTYLLLEIVSEVFGPFVFAVHQYLNEETGTAEAFGAFLSMATCNGPIVRRYCAYNFPGIAKSLGYSFKSDLSGIAEFLSKDSDPETRWNLAAGMHETTRFLMCKNSADNLFRTAEALLQDSNPLVRTNALEHLFELISSLKSDPEMGGRSDKKLSTIFGSLKIFSTDSWRTQELLAKQLERVSPMVPPSCLTDHVLPLLYRMAEESTYLVRKAAMVAIARAIWCIPVPADRERIMQSFQEEWGEGGVYWMRIAFIDCAVAALDLFSANLFAKLFVDKLLKLARDNVCNVRLRLAQMIHQLAPICNEEEGFQEALCMLQGDLDTDVSGVSRCLDKRIEEKMKDLEAFRRIDEEREKAELGTKNKHEQSKAEVRKKGGRGRVRASTILTKLGGKGGSKNERGSGVGELLQRQCSIEDFNLESPASVIDETEDAAIASPSSNGLKGLLRKKSSEEATPPSPNRRSRKLLRLASEENTAPNSANRKSLKSLLSHVGSGLRSKPSLS